MPTAFLRFRRPTAVMLSLFQWDIDFLYYPWKETRLRPYVMAGIGLTDINFTNKLNNSDRVQLPLAADRPGAEVSARRISTCGWT